MTFRKLFSFDRGTNNETTPNWRYKIWLFRRPSGFSVGLTVWNPVCFFIVVVVDIFCDGFWNVHVCNWQITYSIQTALTLNNDCEVKINDESSCRLASPLYSYRIFQTRDFLNIEDSALLIHNVFTLYRLYYWVYRRHNSI